MTKIDQVEPAAEALCCQIEGTKTIYDLVIDEEEGDVSDLTRIALNDHLLRCRTCLTVYSRLKNITRIVRMYPENSVTRRPSGVSFGMGKSRGSVVT
jgi:hypothetical protein